MRNGMREMIRVGGGNGNSETKREAQLSYYWDEYD